MNSIALQSGNPHLQQAMRFAGRSRFSKEQADRMAQTLLAESRRLEITPEKGFAMTETDISSLLQQGKRLPLKGTHLLGLMYPDGSVVSTDSDTGWEKFIQRISTRTKLTTFDKITRYLHPRLPKGVIPPGGLPIVVRERDPASEEKVQEFVKNDLIPHFKIDSDIPMKEGDPRKVLETVTWPFLSNIIANHPISEASCPLARKLKELPVFQVNSPDAPSGVEKVLRAKYDDLHKMLAAVETARHHYSEGLEWKEALLTGSIAGGLGLTGELAVEHYLHDGGPAVALARTGILLSMDVVENSLNSVGMLRSNLEANGLEFSKEGITGKKSWGDILRHPIESLRSPGGIFMKRAATSMVKGTALGAGFSAMAGFGLSEEDWSIGARSGAAAAGALGTATTIPFNTRATLPQVYLATLELIKQGKILLPNAVQSPEDIQEYATEVAKQELCSRLACAASIKGFTLLPFLSIGIVGSEALGVPREYVQRAFMLTAPAMESFLRLFLTAHKQLISVPGKMAKAEKMVLDNPEAPFPEKDRRELARLFADNWSRFSLACMTPFVKMPEPMTLPTPISPESTSICDE